MKKSGILLAVILFLAIVWGGITYVVGNKAEIYYHSLLNDASQFGFVTFTNISYERGFLQSRAQTRMQINFPDVIIPEEGEAEGEAAAELTERTVQLVFEHTLHHGPLPYSSGPAGRYGFGPAIALVETTLTEFSPDQDVLENLLEEIPALQNSIEISRIRLDGTMDSLLEIPSFEYTLEDGKISSGGLKAETVYSLATGAMSGSYEMQSLAFVMPEGGSMACQGFSGEFDLERVLPMLYIGLSKAVVGDMEMNLPSTESGELETVKLEQMELTSNSRFDGKLVHFEQNTTFGGLSITGKKYGPLLIDVEMKNLDAEALSEYQQNVLDLYKDSSSLDPDAIAGTLLPMYVELLGKLVAGDPELNIRNFSLVTPEGNAEGNFVIKLVGIDDINLDDPIMMLQYIQNIDATANLLFDETLVRAIALAQSRSSLNSQVAAARESGQELAFSEEQLEEMVLQQYDQQLEMLLVENYIVREGEKLKSSMTFKQGKLTVNGRALPFFGVN